MKRKLTSRPGKLRLNIKTILVPVDFSGASAQALDYAVPLAAALGAKIILLHVVEVISPIPAEPNFVALPRDIEGLKAASQAQLEKMAAKRIPKPLFDRTALRLGVAYDEIAQAAKSLRAGLVVITTHGRTGFSHILLGSTAERVVRHAPCPVLTVRRTHP